ncbi:uncharacterized protein EAE98_004179 [Botrytis deweyae]|uniref:Uncharacterized protein n=1 Tax=Botrytis deweyae TaxID=2478750 RepID=A0ABQ7ISV9_9HELO|nr:uncharacterized protein EAE98_004179 [Botrytis deweyae]KAF7932880.1 hypothetical protein EAE98_004179 [Botrytis deweyae]
MQPLPSPISNWKNEKFPSPLVRALPARRPQMSESDSYLLVDLSGTNHAPWLEPGMERCGLMAKNTFITPEGGTQSTKHQVCNLYTSYGCEISTQCRIKPHIEMTNVRKYTSLLRIHYHGKILIGDVEKG